MIELNCPHCDHLLRIKSKYAGKKGGCKHCGGFFTVPDTYSPTQNAVAPGGSALDNKDDLPALDPAFAQQMADQPDGRVEPSTSLDDLKSEPVAEAVAASLAPPRVVQVSDAEASGCVFWGAAFLVPPAGLVWSILLPAGHPDKGRGIVVSSSFSVLAILCVMVSAWLGAAVQELSEENESGETVPYETESTSEFVGQTTFSPAPTPPVPADGPPTRTSQVIPQQSSQPMQTPVAGLSFDNFVMPSYPELYLDFPERLTPAMIGRALSSFGKYDARYISIGEGSVVGSMDEIAKGFQRQLTDQGYEASMSFGASTSTGEYRTIKCQGGPDEWFFARVYADDDGADVFVALHAGDSGWAFALPQYTNPDDDPVPAIPGIAFAPPEILTANLLGGIDDALSAFDVRNLVIREAYVDAHFEEIAKSYQDYFKQQGWETGMAFGFDNSGDYRALLAQRDRWAVEIRIENMGNQQSRVIAVSPLQ